MTTSGVIIEFFTYNPETCSAYSDDIDIESKQ